MLVCLLRYLPVWALHSLRWKLLSLLSCPEVPLLLKAEAGPCSLLLSHSVRTLQKLLRTYNSGGTWGSRREIWAPLPQIYNPVGVLRTLGCLVCSPRSPCTPSHSPPEQAPLGCLCIREASSYSQLLQEAAVSLSETCQMLSDGTGSKKVEYCLSTVLVRTICFKSSQRGVGCVSTCLPPKCLPPQHSEGRLITG